MAKHDLNIHSITSTLVAIEAPRVRLGVRVRPGTWEREGLFHGDPTSPTIARSPADSKSIRRVRPPRSCTTHRRATPRRLEQQILLL